MFLWRQDDTSSLRLFSVDSSGRRMIRNFSLRQRLHLLLELLYGECDERMRQEIKCSMVKFILIKSPDEWATTKQACRDELVVYLSFSSIYTTLYLYVLSNVLRKSSFTLYTRSKFSLVEHSTIIRNGKIQHQLLNQEYSFTITQRLPSTTHRKDRAVFTENALESPLLSQSRHDLFFKGNLRLQINQEPTSH